MKVEDVIQRFKKSLQRCKDHPRLKSDELYYEFMLKYYENVERTAREKDRYLAAVGCYTPVELFYAMDIAPLHTEMHAMTVTILEGAAGSLDTAAGYGVPVEVCSIHRAMVGLAVNKDLPPLDIIVCSSGVCDPVIKSFEILNRFYPCPTFFLDQPYLYDDEGVNYYQGQLEKLIAFLEDETQQKLDQDRFQEVVELSRLATNAYREITELRKASPAPVRGANFFSHCMIYLYLAGTPEAVEYFETVLDEVKEQIEERREPLSKEGEIRLSCAFCLPSYSGKLLYWMEKEYGAVIAMDLISHWRTKEEINPSRPLESLAKKAFYAPLLLPFSGPVENWTSSVIEMGKDYQIDGSLVMTNIGCKEGCAAIRILKDKMKDELNIPVLVADCDVIDPSTVPIDEMKNKLEEFFETLQERK